MKHSSLYKNLAILLFFSFLIPGTSFSQSTFSFSSNLSLGAKGVDVLELQKALNMDTRTAVAFSGPGSLGEETDYFGALTRLAVIKFQEIYKNETLVPAQLSSGTGFVGIFTRTKLNNLLTKSPSAVSNLPVHIETPALPNNAVPTFNESALSSLGVGLGPMLYGIEPYFVKPGSNIILRGKGFFGDNQVFIDGKLFLDKIKGSKEGTAINVTLNQTIAIGKHSVFVKNINGTTENQPNAVDVMVVSEVPIPPSITYISPTTIASDSTDEIVITGQNFSPDGNLIVGILGPTKLFPSQSNNIRLKLSDFPGTAQFKNVPIGYKIIVPVYLIIQNSSGTSNPIKIDVIVK
jgi:peptidoglycan hydrolase-like protein with peptidoglycan-binding domain